MKATYDGAASGPQPRPRLARSNAPRAAARGRRGHDDRRRGALLFTALTAAALAFVGGERGAAAQLGGFQLDQFDPAPAGDPFFGVASPQTPGRLTPRFGVDFDYAREPLRVGTGETIVSEQGFLHLGASLAVVDRLLFSVNMPIALTQGGDSPRINGVVLTSPSGVHAGDLRFGGRLRLLGDLYDPLQIALGASLYLPTAGDDNFDGEGAARVKPELIVGGRAGSSTLGFVYTATGGAMLRTSNNPQLVTFAAGAALTLLDDRLQIGPELTGGQQIGSKTPLSGPGVTVAAASATNLELLGGAKLRVLDALVLGAAAGPGIADGVGTPQYRVVGSIAWAPLPKRYAGPPDEDGDGIPDAVDACPHEKGPKSDDPKKNGCPLPDRDGDGIPDQFDACPDKKGRASDDPTINGCPADYDRDGIPDDEDACPNEKGVPSADPKKNGCPGEIDTDGDGIPDKDDACPRVKGVPSPDPARNGCPPATAGDRDGDGIPDDVDACPDERGVPSKDPKKNGCPVGGVAVFDAPTIRFDFGSDAIRPDEADALERAKQAILRHPEVRRFEVQGNSDEVGDAGFNQALSQRRARAVTSWLVAHGVPASRLVPKGYGSSRPLSGPSPDEQHRLNRRVEIVILK